MGAPSSLDQQGCHPPPPSEQDFVGSWSTQNPICDSLGSASRLGFVDRLRLSQIAHSTEMTAGIHVMKELGCFFLSAVRHEPWAVSPG